MFSFYTVCLTKDKESKLPFYLPRAGDWEKMDFYLFQLWSEAVSSRIWTEVVKSIFDDNNYYVKHASMILYMMRNIELEYPLEKHKTPFVFYMFIV